MSTERSESIPLVETGDVIDKLGEQHQKMLDWMLVNYTGKNLGAMAEHFGYSRSWVSSIINSDIFQAEYQKRRQSLNAETSAGIVRKTMEVAEKALTKLHSVLENDGNGGEDSLDPRFILDVADKALHRLGYAPQRASAAPAAPSGNTYVFADKAIINAARERLTTRAANGATVNEPVSQSAG